MAVSEIVTTSWSHREKTPMDAVSDNIPLMFMLRKKGRVKTVGGGYEIREPIRYAQNAYVQLIDANEEFALGYNQTLTAFVYPPKIIVVPTLINALERAQNQGPGEFLDLLDEREQIAEDSLVNVMEQMLQGDGTGYGGKAFPGIKSYIVDSVTGGSYGGLARSTYTAIRNTSINLVSTFTGATDSSNIESRLRYTKNKVVRNGGPELALAGETYFNAACDAMSAKQRFTQNEEMLKANFDNVMIEGMTMVNAQGKAFSGLSRIAVDRAYLIRLDNYALKMYRGFNLEPVKDRTAYNQLVDASIVCGIGSFTCNGAGLSAVCYDS